jgi:hypothetical protein
MILSYSGTTYDCSVEPIAACLAALFEASRHPVDSTAWELAQDAITAIANHSIDAATRLNEILGIEDQGLPNTEHGIKYITEMVNSNSKWQK